MPNSTTHLDEAAAPENFTGLASSKEYEEGYEPSESEEYMNPKHLAYFRDMLQTWKAELENEAQATVMDLQNSSIEADLNDQASVEETRAFELRTRDRARKLIKKIDEALERIVDGDYGYCEATGDPIGIKRLLARPIATLCIEEKRRQEQEESSYAG